MTRKEKEVKDFVYDFDEEEREEEIFEEYYSVMMNCHILKNNKEGGVK